MSSIGSTRRDMRIMVGERIWLRTTCHGLTIATLAQGSGLTASSAATRLRAGHTSLHPITFSCIDRSAYSYHQYSTTLLYIVQLIPFRERIHQRSVQRGKHPLTAILQDTIHRHYTIPNTLFHCLRQQPLRIFREEAHNLY